MELYDFLKHLNSGAPVYSDSEAFEYMHELSNEAMRITFRLNGSYHTPEGQGCFVRSDSPWTRTVDAKSQKHEPPDKLITRQLVRISYNLLSVFRKYRLGCVYTSINNVPVSDGSGPKRSATVRSHRRPR